MTNQSCSHKTCRNYAPVDVVKGLCHLSKNLVDAASPSCDQCEALPLCKLCKHYTATSKEFVGSCSAQKTPFFTYPDLVATTCEWFVWTAH